jgi:hypothetical protein
MYPLKGDLACGCYPDNPQRTYEKGACPVADDLYERATGIGPNQ